MTDPAIAAWSRESDLLFALRQLREENKLLKTQPEWVGLTDDEVHALSPFYIEPSLYDMIRAAEAKLKEKNT